MYIHKTCILAAAAVMLMVSSAVAQELAGQGPPRRLLPAGIRGVYDIPYVPRGGPRQSLDLYLPDPPQAPRPLIIYIHGGGWREGDKADCPAIAFVRRGYVVASINYRFSQEAIFPAQIHDCKAAVRFLRANAAEYGIIPGRIGAWGSSAGGHLAAMLGVAGRSRELEGEIGVRGVSSRVQAVVDWYGPTDLLRLASQMRGGLRANPDAPDSAPSRLIGGPLQENRAIAARASPITYVNGDEPPFLIMHGRRDNLVPPAQSELLAEALRRAGVPVTLHMLKDDGHGGPGFFAPNNVRLMNDFFDGHLKGR